MITTPTCKHFLDIGDISVNKVQCQGQTLQCVIFKKGMTSSPEGGEGGSGGSGSSSSISGGGGRQILFLRSELQTLRNALKDKYFVDAGKPIQICDPSTLFSLPYSLFCSLLFPGAAIPRKNSSGGFYASFDIEFVVLLRNLGLNLPSVTSTRGALMDFKYIKVYLPFFFGSSSSIILWC
jgi:hypothetical protein